MARERHVRDSTKARDRNIAPRAFFVCSVRGEIQSYYIKQKLTQRSRPSRGDKTFLDWHQAARAGRLGWFGEVALAVQLFVLTVIEDLSSA